MIKLKNILNEFTDNNFKVHSESNAAKTFKVLDQFGWFKGLGKTNKKTIQRIKQFEGGRMFVHVANHKGYVDNFGDLKGFPKGDTDVRLHRTEYWLRGEDVNTTYLSVDINNKPVGGVFVDTTIWLKMLKKANSEGFND